MIKTKFLIRDIQKDRLCIDGNDLYIYINGATKEDTEKTGIDARLYSGRD